MFKSSYSTSQKVDKISYEMMGNVDALVTGYYKDDGEGFPTITIIPLVIVKRDRKSSIKKLTLNKKEYLCPDPANLRIKALCTGAHEKIARAVKELLEQL